MWGLGFGDLGGRVEGLGPNYGDSKGQEHGSLHGNQYYIVVHRDYKVGVWRLLDMQSTFVGSKA